MNKSNGLIIETRDLEFGFGKREKTLKKINLKVERGSIFGFLGPNGAGKTTTIRLLLGLLNDRKNSINLFGKELSHNRLEIFSKVGALIEQPSLYEHISGYDNLLITCLIKKVNKSSINKVLELVNLSNAAHKKVKSYSLGMKQRLGIALTLLSEPELLILDEPVNGLDPNGIVEIRELIKKINSHLGTTIFLSSHLLSEIEKIATHIGIINMGELLFQGTIDDLIKHENVKRVLRVETDDAKTAFEIIKNKFEVTQNESTLRVTYNSRKQVAQVIQELVTQNINIFEAVAEDRDLEQFFLRMTENYKVS